VQADEDDDDDDEDEDEGGIRGSAEPRLSTAVTRSSYFDALHRFTTVPCYWLVGWLTNGEIM